MEDRIETIKEVLTKLPRKTNHESWCGRVEDDEQQELCDCGTSDYNQALNEVEMILRQMISDSKVKLNIPKDYDKDLAKKDKRDYNN